MSFSPLAVAVLLLSGLVVYLGLSGRLGSTWDALQGHGSDRPGSTVREKG